MGTGAVCHSCTLSRLHPSTHPSIIQFFHFIHLFFYPAIFPPFSSSLSNLSNFFPMPSTCTFTYSFLYPSISSTCSSSHQVNHHNFHPSVHTLFYHSILTYFSSVSLSLALQTIYFLSSLPPCPSTLSHLLFSCSLR